MSGTTTPVHVAGSGDREIVQLNTVYEDPIKLGDQFVLTLSGKVAVKDGYQLSDISGLWIGLVEHDPDDANNDVAITNKVSPAGEDWNGVWFETSALEVKADGSFEITTPETGNRTLLVTKVPNLTGTKVLGAKIIAIHNKSEAIVTYTDLTVKIDSVDNKKISATPTFSDPLTEHTTNYFYGQNSDLDSLTVVVDTPSDNGTVTYQWYKKNGSSAAEAIDGEISASYELPAAANASTPDYDYYCVVTNSKGGDFAPAYAKSQTVSVKNHVLVAPNIQATVDVADVGKAVVKSARTYSGSGTPSGELKLDVYVKTDATDSIDTATIDLATVANDTNIAYASSSSPDYALKTVATSVESVTTENDALTGTISDKKITFKKAQTENTTAAENPFVFQVKAKSSANGAVEEQTYTLSVHVVDDLLPHTSVAPTAATLTTAGYAVNTDAASVTPLNAEPDNASAIATAGGTLSYQWYKAAATSGIVADGNKIANATNAEYTPLVTETGLTYYTCVVTNTEDSKFPASTVASAETKAVAILVTNITAQTKVGDAEAVGEIITNGTLSTTAATDKKVILTVDVGGATGATYQWKTGTVGSGSAATGTSTNAAYEIDAASAVTATTYYCEVTIGGEPYYTAGVAVTIE